VRVATAVLVEQVWSPERVATAGQEVRRMECHLPEAC
jgi:hypothetical protein